MSICNRIRVGKSFILGVFIKSGLFQEAFDFEAFIRPFDASTWLCLFCSAALLTICIINIWKTTNCKKEMLSNGVKVYLKILQTNLGKDSYIYGRNTPHWSLKIWNHTANDYRQTTDKLIFKHVISTLRWIRK